MSRFRFAILACSASKAATALPARELYTGALFRQSLALAELQADRVLILSAKHGVVEASQVLEPYDQQLPTEKHRREQWGEQVALKLVQAFGITSRSSIPEGREVGRSVLCLAPQSYVKTIGHLYGVDEWSQPLRHLGIGQQKRKLAELIAEAAPARSLASMVLQLEETFGGDPSSDFELPATYWQKLVDAARREGSR